MKRTFVVLVAACSSATAPAPAPTSADVEAGKLVGGVTTTDDLIRVGFAGRDVPVADIPAVRGWIGLPVSGRATVDIAVEIPRAHGVGDYSRARGKIRVQCTGCAIGDDVARLDAFMMGPIDFGRIAISRLEMSATIADGKAILDHWRIESPDVTLRVDLAIDFARDLGESAIRGCIRFHPTEALLNHSPKTSAVLSTTGAELRADGNFHIKLAGTIDHLQRLNADCGATNSAE